ncbi:hypothetical protein [Natrinema pallidum]|uniref:Uncharacterized protein n=1 Tax=Natrinema pallidum TaxID=69527 RepID=A0A4P9TBI0_9EURY|nr:hypothetical protein [Natrinema pallidum]QCW01998.1 hypothetical protein FGF80_01525 [Natrinema pallidum]
MTAERPSRGDWDRDPVGSVTAGDRYWSVADRLPNSAPNWEPSSDVRGFERVGRRGFEAVRDGEATAFVECVCVVVRVDVSRTRAPTGPVSGNEESLVARSPSRRVRDGPVGPAVRDCEPSPDPLHVFCVALDTWLETNEGVPVTGCDTAISVPAFGFERPERSADSERDESGLESGGRIVRSLRPGDGPRSERSRRTGIRPLESGGVVPARSRVVPDSNRRLLEVTAVPRAVFGSEDAAAGSVSAADGCRLLEIVCEGADGVSLFDIVTGVAVVAPDAALERGCSSERVPLSPSCDRVRETDPVREPPICVSLPASDPPLCVTGSIPDPRR